MSPSDRAESTDPAATHPMDDAWPALPTETEIYILSDGRVVVADLPAELSALVASLGVVEPCAVDAQGEGAA